MANCFQDSSSGFPIGIGVDLRQRLLEIEVAESRRRHVHSLSGLVRCWLRYWLS
jgi:hypothetical protein